MYKNRKKRMRKVAAICSLILLLAGCNNQSEMYVKQQTQGTEAESESSQSAEEAQREDSQPAEEAGSESSQSAEEAGNETETAEIYVQVSGAVTNPGVYKLTEGSRIFEAVELAGGVTAQADVNSVNQAEVLSDGQMIYVYALGEQQSAEASGTEQEDGRVNLNTATAEQLMTLPGIGQSKAESIIAYREEQGSFENIEDIMNIEGIKDGVFSKIKDRIKVN